MFLFCVQMRMRAQKRWVRWPRSHNHELSDSRSVSHLICTHRIPRHAHTLYALLSWLQCMRMRPGFQEANLCFLTFLYWGIYLHRKVHRSEVDSLTDFYTVKYSCDSSLYSQLYLIWKGRDDKYCRKWRYNFKISRWYCLEYSDIASTWIALRASSWYSLRSSGLPSWRAYESRHSGCMKCKVA